MDTPAKIRNLLVDHFGGYSETARRLKVSAALVSKWHRKYMSIPMAFRVELITRGKFKSQDLVSPDQKEDVLIMKEVIREYEK